eukprot:Hpha_TRINITY_DN22345_c0_g1::TRINITY_DN22345_c0_g1_i1::g.177759::m.177759
MAEEEQPAEESAVPPRHIPPWCFSYAPVDGAVLRLLERQRERSTARRAGPALPAQGAAQGAVQGWTLVRVEELDAVPEDERREPTTTSDLRIIAPSRPPTSSTRNDLSRRGSESPIVGVARRLPMENVAQAHAAANRAATLMTHLEDGLHTDAYDRRQGQRLRSTMQERTDRLMRQFVLLLDVMEAPPTNFQEEEEAGLLMQAATSSIQGLELSLPASPQSGNAGRPGLLRNAISMFASGAAAAQGSDKQRVLHLFDVQNAELRAARERAEMLTDELEENRMAGVSKERHAQTQMERERKELLDLKRWIISQGSAGIPGMPGRAVNTAAAAVAKFKQAGRRAGSPAGSPTGRSSPISFPSAPMMPADEAGEATERLQDVTVVVCGVKEYGGLAEIWALDGEALFKALRRVTTMLSALVLRLGGTVARADVVGGIIAYFPRPRAALHFALGAQGDLLRENWPERLTRYKCFRTLRESNTVVWNGPRVAMSLVHSTQTIFSSLSRAGCHLAGADIAVAQNLQALAAGGECLIHGETWKTLQRESVNVGGGPVTQEVTLPPNYNPLLGTKKGTDPLEGPVVVRVVPAVVKSRLDLLPPIPVAHSAKADDLLSESSASLLPAPPSAASGKPVASPLASWGYWVWAANAKSQDVEEVDAQPEEDETAVVMAEAEELVGKGEITALPRHPGGTPRCVVVVSIPELHRVAGKTSTATAEAYRVYSRTVRKLMLTQSAQGMPELGTGVVSWVRPSLISLDRDECTALFMTVPEAVRWSISLQRALQDAPVPHGYSSFWFGGVDPAHLDRSLWSGVRVSIGIHYGDTGQKRHAVTGFAHLAGAGFDYAQALAHAARGGEILVSDVVKQAARADKQICSPEWNPLIVLVSDPEETTQRYRVWQMFPSELMDRSDTHGRLRLQRMKVLRQTLRAAEGPTAQEEKEEREAAEREEAMKQKEFGRFKRGYTDDCRDMEIQTDAKEIRERMEAFGGEGDFHPRKGVLTDKEVVELLRMADEKPFGQPPRALRELVGLRLIMSAPERSALRRQLYLGLVEVINQAHTICKTQMKQLEVAQEATASQSEQIEKLSAKLRTVIAESRLRPRPVVEPVTRHAKPTVTSTVTPFVLERSGPKPGPISPPNSPPGGGGALSPRALSPRAEGPSRSVKELMEELTGPLPTALTTPPPATDFVRAAAGGRVEEEPGKKAQVAAMQGAALGLLMARASPKALRPPLASASQSSPRPTSLPTPAGGSPPSILS